jgi:NAD-dependent dihydropyrimidine dehydrogenase PreA subunit
MDNMRILFCRCSGTDLLAPAAREAIASALGGANSAAQVWIVDDLCGLAERRDQRLAQWASGEGSPVVIACHERAVRALFEFAGRPLPAAERVVNVRGASVEEAIGMVQSLGQASAQSPSGVPNDADKQAGSNVGLPVGAVEPLTKKSLEKIGTDGIVPASEERIWGQTPISNSEIGLSPHIRGGIVDPQLSDWQPWYPLIDSARCVQCKKCLGFCLFGVYAMDGDKVRVANPRACKNNCPACARVCPQLAIIFPKCKDSPINGAAIREQDLARKDLKVDVDAIARSGDLYAELRKRATNVEKPGSSE